MSDTIRAWARIINWLEKNHPALAKDLLPGVEEEEMEKFEEAVGHKMPDDFRESYFACGGQNGEPCGLFLGYELNSLDSIVNIWCDLDTYADAENLFSADDFTSMPSNTVQPVEFQNGWIPFSGGDAATMALGIDLQPGSKGTRGQVITFGAKELYHEVIAPSFADFLTEFAALLDRGCKVDQKGKLYIPHPAKKKQSLDLFEALAYFRKTERPQ